MVERRDRRNLLSQPLYLDIYGKYTSPDHLRGILQAHPLDKRAVDWIADEGTRIIEEKSDFSHGAYYWMSNLIFIYSVPSQEEERDVTVVHELYHVLVPRIYWTSHNALDDVLTEAARPLAHDREFMRYVIETVPYICRPKRRLIFPTWPINSPYSNAKLEMLKATPSQ